MLAKFLHHRSNLCLHKLQKRRLISESFEVTKEGKPFRFTSKNLGLAVQNQDSQYCFDGFGTVGFFKLFVWNSKLHFAFCTWQSTVWLVDKLFFRLFLYCIQEYHVCRKEIGFRCDGDSERDAEWLRKTPAQKWGRRQGCSETLGIYIYRYVIHRKENRWSRLPVCFQIHKTIPGRWSARMRAWAHYMSRQHAVNAKATPACCSFSSDQYCFASKIHGMILILQHFDPVKECCAWPAWRLAVTNVVWGRLGAFAFDR